MDLQHFTEIIHNKYLQFYHVKNKKVISEVFYF